MSKKKKQNLIHTQLTGMQSVNSALIFMITKHIESVNERKKNSTRRYEIGRESNLIKYYQVMRNVR